MGHRAQTVDTPTLPFVTRPTMALFLTCTSVPSRHWFLLPQNSNSPKRRADKTNKTG
jgi:hypothetical protein